MHCIDFKHFSDRHFWHGGYERPATVQSFLDVRTAVLNNTLKDSFRRRHPGFLPANDD